MTLVCVNLIFPSTVRHISHARYLRVGLSRQHRLQNGLALLRLVGDAVNHRRRSAASAEQIELAERLERRLGHADRRGVQLGHAVIRLVAALPYSVVLSMATRYVLLDIDKR